MNTSLKAYTAELRRRVSRNPATPDAEARAVWQDFADAKMWLALLPKTDFERFIALGRELGLAVDEIEGGER